MIVQATDPDPRRAAAPDREAEGGATSERAKLSTDNANRGVKDLVDHDDLEQSRQFRVTYRRSASEPHEAQSFEQAGDAWRYVSSLMSAVEAGAGQPPLVELVVESRVAGKWTNRRDLASERPAGNR